MSKKNIHITYRKDNGKWQVKKEGNSKASKLVDTKKEAEKVGRELAKNEKSELIIHNKDGKISDSDSFGNESKTKDTVH